MMLTLPLLLAAALPGAAEMTRTGDLAAAMVQSIDSYLTRQLVSPAQARPGTRERFRKIIGLIDERVPPSAPRQLESVAKTQGYEVLAVSWAVLRGVDAEGLLLEPAGPVTCNVVALPDADMQPETVVALYASRLAENGCRVLIPVLIDRKDTWSGNPAIGRMTNQSHREYIYRMAYQTGRHIIGYEVQKVLAAIDWFATLTPAAPATVIGYGEGGLVALYSSAADERIATTITSGYFRNRNGVHGEPLYRNVWGLLPEFGDAELLRMIAPRRVLIEAQRHPNIAGPNAETPTRRGAAPGSLATPELAEVEREIARAGTTNATLVNPPGEPTLKLFVGREPVAPQAVPALIHAQSAGRMERQFRQLVDFTQAAVRGAGKVRAAYWAKADLSSPEAWARTSAPYREALSANLLGRLPATRAAMKPESRPVYDNHLFAGHEVYLPVVDEVFAYGILLVPKNLKAGERRPLVIAQHGLEGRPQEIIEPTQAGEMRTYQRFAARLAERGFIVFAPQNPYIGRNVFRQVERKAEPLGLTLFSFVAAQNSRMLDYLETLPFVDPGRIGFYGLSYGGYTAMRIPPLDPRYKAVVCSGNFNEWSWKVTTDQETFSYLFTGEYEIHEFDQANTFGHFEMAALIAPRPFMVERGHADGVGIDEWVAWEYAKVRRLYAQWQRASETEIEWFNGIHQIWGEGTFRFLHRHLRWP